MFHGVSSVSTRYADGYCELGAFTAKDVDGIGEKGLVAPTVVDVGGGQTSRPL